MLTILEDGKIALSEVSLFSLESLEAHVEQSEVRLSGRRSGWPCGPFYRLHHAQRGFWPRRALPVAPLPFAEIS